MSSAAKKARTKTRQAKGHFVVANVPEEGGQVLRDCGIAEGDEILAPDGFPDRPDVADPPVVEHRRSVARTLHPNVAWFLHDAGVLVLKPDA